MTIDWRRDLLRASVANRLARRHDAEPGPAAGQPVLGTPGDLGYVALGPILFDFVAWLYRQAVADAIATLHFCGPEARLLSRLWERITRVALSSGATPAIQQRPFRAVGDPLPRGDALVMMSPGGSAAGANRTYSLWAPTVPAPPGQWRWRHADHGGAAAPCLGTHSGAATAAAPSWPFVGSAESVQAGVLDFADDLVVAFGHDALALDFDPVDLRLRLDLALSWPPRLAALLDTEPARPPAPSGPRSAPARVLILVLGMHRSGTSALTRVVNLLGADNARDLLGPWRSNPTGHWEPLALQQFHDEVLAASGSHWDDPRPIRLDPARAAGWRRTLAGILGDQYGESRFFVVKDPRVCRLVPLWLDFCAESAIRPVAVLPIRSPFEVAASLETRDGFQTARSLRLWLRHVLEAEVQSRGIRRAIVAYRDLLDDWTGVAARISAETGVDWPCPIAQAGPAVAAFLDPGLRHAAAESGAVSGDPLAMAAAQAFEALLALGRTPGDPMALGLLDDLRDWLDAQPDSTTR